MLAQVAQQGIDIWHAGPIGAFVEEEVIRWLGDLVGYGEGRFGILTSGGVMANFIAMAVIRDVHLQRLRGGSARHLAAGPSRASASTPPTRPISRSAARWTSWAFRRRRSRSCPRTGASGSAATPWPRPSGAIVARACCRLLSRRSRAPRTPAPSTPPASWRTSPRPRACGCTSTPRTAPRLACRRGTLGACRTSSGRTRSRSTRTSGCSRRTTSAAWWCGSAVCSSSRSAAAGRSTTAPATRRRTGRPRPAGTGTTRAVRLPAAGWRAAGLRATPPQRTTAMAPRTSSTSGAWASRAPGAGVR